MLCCNLTFFRAKLLLGCITHSMKQVNLDCVSGSGRLDCEAADLCAFSLAGVPLTVSEEDLAADQQVDPSLRGLFEQVLATDEVTNSSQGYFKHKKCWCENGCRTETVFFGDPVIQIVLPAKFGESVLKLAHDEAEHWGVNGVLRHFFWPRVKQDVATYIKTCHTCQIMGKPTQKKAPASLSPIQAVNQLFQHLIIDCVGPLPQSRTGANYLLTVMCQSTHYLAAYALRTITAGSVVRALTQFISIFDISKIIQTDQGSNFSSHLFLPCTETTLVRGVLERFHLTLKSLLWACCVQLGGYWEKGLPWLMLLAREVTQESTGFSPNKLVFGHMVQGPLSLL